MSTGNLTGSAARSSPRIHARAEVGVFLEGKTDPLMGRLSDLSISGLQVQTAVALAQSSTVQVVFRFPDDPEPLRSSAEVMWCTTVLKANGKRASNAGLKFEGLGEDDFVRLRTFVDQQMWTLLAALRQIPLFQEFNDLEKMQLAALCFHCELQDGETLDRQDTESSLFIVTGGQILQRQYNSNGSMRIMMAIPCGAWCGALPVADNVCDPFELVAQGPAQVLGVRGQGYLRFTEEQPGTAVKLLAGYSGALIERLRTHEIAAAAALNAGAPVGTG